MCKRKCRKCESVIPIWTRIDGKNRNLQNRKFCLSCSPFRGHNTKPDDPLRPSKKSGPYSNWTEEVKENNKQNIYKRGWERKVKLVKLAGGCCKKCGYNKSMRALTFHHREPDQKKFGLTQSQLWSRKWSEIMNEFNKCDIYCQNCHAEKEDELKKNDPNYWRNVFDFWDDD